jgi:hypothetical protein
VRTSIFSTGLDVAVIFNYYCTMKYIYALLFTAVLFVSSTVDTDKDLAKVYSKQGKQIFTHCLPVAEYETLFTVKMPAVIYSNKQVNSIGKIEDFVQKRANNQAMKMGLVYDALIVNGWDNSYAIKFK